VVLTAAHCVVEEARTAAPGELLVAAGAPFRSAATPAQLYAVERVHPHPGFPAGAVDDARTGLGRDDDIAVLVLARDADTVPVSRILDPALAALHVARGRWVRIAGYGVTNTMFPAGTLSWADATLAARSDHEILVGGTGMPDTCYGDSGGPTFLLVGAEWALIGVTSRARLDRTTPCGDGSIDTLAPAYLDWIAEVSSGAYSLDAGPGLDAGPRPDTGPSTPGRWRACGCAVPARSRSLDATFVTSALFLLALARRAARSLPEPSPPRRDAARGR
jgi:hypothetical protein